MLPVSALCDDSAVSDVMTPLIASGITLCHTCMLWCDDSTDCIWYYLVSPCVTHVCCGMQGGGGWVPPEAAAAAADHATRFSSWTCPSCTLINAPQVVCCLQSIILFTQHHPDKQQ